MTRLMGVREPVPLGALGDLDFEVGLVTRVDDELRMSRALGVDRLLRDPIDASVLTDNESGEWRATGCLTVCRVKAEVTRVSERGDASV